VAERRYTLRFDPEFHTRLRIAIAERGIRTIQDAIFQALEQWANVRPSGSEAGGEPVVPKRAGKDRALFEALARVLQSGDKQAIDAIRSCLALADRQAGKKTKTKGRR